MTYTLVSIHRIHGNPVIVPPTRSESLLRLKERALIVAQALEHEGVDFHLYITDEFDPLEVYMEIYTKDGKLGPVSGDERRN